MVVAGLLFGLSACTGDRPDPPPVRQTDSSVAPVDSDPVETGDSDSGEAPPPPDLIALVADYRAEARWLVRETGEVWGRICLTTWFPAQCASALCRLIGFQHDQVDGKDRFTYAYLRPLVAGESERGGIIALEPGQHGKVAWDLVELDFETWLPDIYDGVCHRGSQDELCAMWNPHAVARLPSGTWVVADTKMDRHLFLDIDTTETQPVGVVRAALDVTTVPAPHWEGCRGTNNVETWLEGDTVFVLTTCRGDESNEGSMTRRGSVVLWDATDVSDVRRVWRYPEEGYLKAPHHGRVVEGPDGPLLVYGHSQGDSGSENDDHGTVGFARFSSAAQPTYLGDGRLPKSVGQWGFVRAVTPLPDGEGLLVSDSGCETIAELCEGATPRLVEIAWPDLEPAGLFGTYEEDHSDQAFFELEVLRVLEGEELGQPYESMVLRGEELGEALSEQGGASCPE